MRLTRPDGPPRDLLLNFKLALGDSVVLSGLLRDIAAQYPQTRIALGSVSFQEVFQHAPYLTPRSRLGRQPTVVRPDYGNWITRSKHEPVHFLHALHRDFAKQTGWDVPLRAPRPDLHLSAEEQTPPLDGRYWVVLSGGKTDFTAKVWPPAKFQRVVDILRTEFGVRCVQAGACDSKHWHPPLEGALPLTGQTTARGLIRLIRHADGVICGVTAAMHIAAALERPCVVLAGGREAWWWEAYVRENPGLPGASQLRHPHRFLHTIGLLDCVPHQGGCWRSKTVDLGGTPADKICLKPERHEGVSVPACLNLVTPEHVVAAVMSYYQDASLPPIGQPLALPSIAPELRLPAGTEPSPLPRVVHKILIPARRPVNTVVPATGPLVMPAAAPAGDVFDHETIGGKLTIFVLLYGGFTKIHTECLTALQRTLPAGRFELRVGSNELSPPSLRLVERLQEAGFISAHYRHETNDAKYPVMRQMLHDPERPITTNWFLWLDDDTITDRNPRWFELLCSRIIETSPRSEPYAVRQVGPSGVWTFTAEQLEWVRTRPWYKGRDWQNSRRQPDPAGRKLTFATGSFWAMHTETAKLCDIPDPSIIHNGGDYMIGAALWQNGFTHASFSQSKTIVRWSAYARRGRSDPHTGTKGALAQQHHHPAPGVQLARRR